MSGTDTSTTSHPQGTAEPADGPPSGAVERWWKLYCGPETIDRGARARLRRCRSTRDALSEPAAITLARWLGAVATDDARPGRGVERALDLARVLAHVEEDDRGQRPMRAAGWKEFPGGRNETDIAPEKRPVLSQIRFRRLLATDGGEELVRAFIRLVGLLNDKVNVQQLAWDFRNWDHPTQGDKVRNQWAFDYYAASSATSTADRAGSQTEADQS